MYTLRFINTSQFYLALQPRVWKHNYNSYELRTNWSHTAVNPSTHRIQVYEARCAS
jgi:hypothetical protein